MRTPARALLILGMHRSGTSSFAGLAQRLGVPLGEDLLPANDWNPRGYGEHRGVVEIHDRFLEAQGLAWDSPRAPHDFSCAAAEEARAALRELLLRDFADTPLFAVKDPRLCRLLPLWRPVLGELGIAEAPVLVLRPALEIAGSLERRDAMPRAHALLLFMQHVLAAERETRGAKRSFVGYREIVSDWRGVAKRVAGELALDWPRDPEAAAEDVDTFLSPQLRHERAPGWPRAEAERFPWAARLEEALDDVLEHGESRERLAALDAIAAELAQAATLYDAELSRLADEVASAEARSREEASERTHAERRLGRLARSPWVWLRTFWRVRLRGGSP